jgi:AcrR family transcriptional regulator
MAKGAVYLWFRSKEEIFVALLEEGFLSLLASMVPVIESLPSDPASAAKDFAAAYVRLLDAVPDVVPLSSVPNSIFRENMPVESLSRMNRSLGAGLSEAGNLLERHFPRLLPGQGTDLLLRTWTMTVGLWLMLEKSDELWRILDAPALSIFRREFHTELETGVTQLWRGAMSCGREAAA